MLPLIQKRAYSGIRAGVRCRTLTCPIPGKAANILTADEAVSVVKSHDSVYVHGTPSTPTDLVAALCRHVEARDVTNVTATHIILCGPIPWLEPRFYHRIRSNCFFIDGATRSLVQAGHADYVPVHLQDSVKLFDDKTIKVDVALVTVSPPDAHGFCSLGANLENASAACRNATRIVGAINASQPRTFGDSLIHVSQFDSLTHSETPIFEMPVSVPSPAEALISKHIAENLVEDGATLQTGIGSIPDTVLDLLQGHRNLGVHTELVSTGVVDLIEKGVITNAKKAVDVGKMLACFAMGTRRFYDKIDNNNSFVFASAGYTNNIEVISRQSKMTAINSAIEIDLTGQVVSDSIGDTLYSGFGGQVDFINGAAQSADGRGRAILCLPSRTSRGESRIVPYIRQGAGVVTSRAHVRFVVTEHGIADLFGKNIRQRCFELIRIAHPEDRELLEKAAFDRFKCVPSNH